jgi:molybdenum cofactor cytidylyltransferase
MSTCALILAAGLSSRMGRPKMVLPWGESTVIHQVISKIKAAGIDNIYVVIGGSGDLVKNALAGIPVHFIYNPIFQNGEMLDSIQTGIRNLPIEVDYVLVALGDQPQIKTDVILKMIDIQITEDSRIIIPSYQMRRGHPWLIHSSLWKEILSLKPPQTMRNFMNNNQDNIRYLVVQNDSIIMDLDTPEDYLRFRPGDI